MIVAHLADRYLRSALCRAAHPEEDVILDPELALQAVDSGYPRVVLRMVGEGYVLPRVAGAGSIRMVSITPQMLAGWESERRRSELPPSRVEHLTLRLRELIEKQVTEVTWVDRALGDLGRAAGAPLPSALRALGRRILEFPSHYIDLHPLAETCGLTRGALKARFRRRSLSSPYAYLRWFRVIATANLLSDRSVTVAQAAHRMGFTSDGNLCRAVRSLTGLTPTEVRPAQGWNRLLITFVRQHLSEEELDAWRGMEDLFQGGAARQAGEDGGRGEKRTALP